MQKVDLSEKVSVGIVTRRENQGLSVLLKNIKDQYPKVSILLVNAEEEKENDLGKNRGKIIASCKTEYIAFIDDDCVPGQGWLESLVKSLSQARQENSLVVGYGGGQILSSSFSSFFYDNSWLPSPQINKEKKVFVDHIPTCNAIFIKDEILSVGNFETVEHNVGEDLLLGRKLIIAGKKLIKGKVPKVLHNQAGSWLLRVFRYGSAQSFVALRLRGRRIPVRNWLQLLFLPTFLFFSLEEFPLVFLALSCLWGFALYRLYKARKNLLDAIVFPFLFFLTLGVYSLGMWKGLLFYYPSVGLRKIRLATR